MNPQEAAYTLKEQLPTIDYIQTGHGKIKLTREMKSIVRNSLVPILSKIVTQYGFKHFCRSCGRGLFLSEILRGCSDLRGLCSDCYEKELQARGEG
ncbi:hypothetical protein [Desulfobacter vibrioformis]|uniref:hypothetical protein n=1 Tax=Desulfobacter vibrioformis TaxID=34031 RepID=UPI0012EBD0C5|nr:hypothetical protein [Desulfobacter vibrioformis]